MSKYVKGLIANDLSKRLSGVDDALLVNVVGLDAGQTYVLRKDLRDKNISLMVVKNSLVKRATEGTPLSAAFKGIEGTTAVVWGAEDFISLVKEITEIDKKGGFAKFETRGGVMDGEQLSAEKVKEISKWPNRQQQLSILLGQILSPGAKLASQLIAPGGALASQIEKKSEGADASDGEAESEAAGDEAAAGGEAAAGSDATADGEAVAAGEAAAAGEAVAGGEAASAGEAGGGDAAPADAPSE
jgi:large subunit ribosomal protein L10